ncbi:MAG: bifunctional tetrahydrofolate synthase/dihydrofolate synthase [Gammaproteobacteria bacterium]|nr:bifunctional tetrahydrofolate synthase/dihydrofolate synthase [Gammaproteobacteria bacterium]
MRFNTLSSWLDWQATLNPVEINLGLERIADVLQRMGLASEFECPLIIVAGTNGKGSVVSLLESMAAAAGLKVCCYTSPHIIRYNERIRINGKTIDDASLCRAFERIDQARGEVALTYFEFGTLAAIDLFMQARPDLVIMEIGLGGRLDAVNIMEPDVSVITSIAIDHTDWLGDNREDIGREKAGIMRAHKPTICGDLEPPESLHATALQKSAEFFQLGQHYKVEPASSANWTLVSPFGDLQNLPPPALHGEFQKGNAATAIMALQVLGSKLVITQDHICQGLLNVHLQGRFQKLHEQPRVIVDVAHNSHAVTSLVRQLQTQPVAGLTRIVIAMLADKPVDEVISILSPVVDYWYCAGLETESRGLSAQAMADKIAQHLKQNESLAQASADVKLCPALTVQAAIEAAMHDAQPQDRIIILGSFYTVAAAMRYFS